MRICYIYGGTEKTDGGIGFLRNLCMNLQILGHKCFCILGAAEENLLGDTVEKEFHLKGDWSLNFSDSSKRNRSGLRKILKSISPDTIHIIYPSAYYGANGHLQSLPILWNRSNIITSFWGLNIGKYSNFKARLTTGLLLYGSKFVATHSYYLKRYLNALCFKSRIIYFLPVGSNILPSEDILKLSRDELKKIYDLKYNYKYLAHFGGFDLSRNFVNLFDAIALLKSKGFKNLKLLMIGWGRHLDNPKFGKIKALINMNGLQKDVIMTPFAKDADVIGLMRASDLCIFPFTKNAIGRSSLMAALSAEIPIIVTSNLREELKDYEDAIYTISPNSSKDLSNAIIYLLENKNISESLAKNAKQLWLRNFTWDIIAKKHLEIYNKIK